MRGNIVCSSFNISTWASINWHLDAGCRVGQEMIDRFMCRVASVFPYGTLKMLPGATKLKCLLQVKKNP